MGIMAKAMWEGAVLAESDATVEVEGNQYFPPNSILKEYFKVSDAHSVCPWKGTASYYDLEGREGGEVGADPNLRWMAPYLEAADMAARLRATYKLRTPDASAGGNRHSGAGDGLHYL
jgi:uncharacterized protein (DUF427 family)